MDKVLQAARDAHRKRTGHTRFTIGMNFINCQECKRHALLYKNGEFAIRERRNYLVSDPDQF